MEKILDLSSELDIKLFDEVVSTALNPSSSNKSVAESILLQFKDLPDSWFTIDSILKNSSLKQSRFIALQILEETVKSKWVLFSEDRKAKMRQYVFSTVVERASMPSDIILRKFNAVLIEIVKKDWPKKWPSFITDLIAVSQSTSMQVSMNSLVILKSINEQVFIVDDEITTARKMLLRRALKQEYFTIFHFISMILEYSETQEIDDMLLESCLSAFKSFCRSMPPEFVFSTKIVDYILGHLNSPHSVAAIDCLLEIVELKKTNEESNLFDRTAEIVELERQKIALIHRELLGFFKMYLGKFESYGEASKIHLAYRKMEEPEKMFVRKYARIFSSMYSNWIYELNLEHVRQGLGYLVQLTKIDDPGLFKETFPTWAKIIYEMYSEYPLRIPTSKPLKRNSFSHIFEAMLPVFVSNMPRPEEVFIIVNDLGEIVKDRKIETVEIDFYKKMRSNMFYLSYCIEDYMVDFFVKQVERFISTGNFDHDLLNKVCWAIGSMSNALEESVEREFFVSIIKNLLSMCEIRNTKEEKAIIASNIMFIIGQYYRFLKYHNEFLIVVVKKLFEFMEETYEGIKEMACDNFYKICERCPSQFFIKKDKAYFYETILNDLGAISMNLDYYLQRTVIEGLLMVLKSSQKKDMRYIEVIYGTLTNQTMLDERYIGSIHTVIHEPSQLKMAVHLIESYSLGFKVIPELFHNINVLDRFLYFYKHISQPEMAFDSIVKKNLQTVKTALAALNESAVCSGYLRTEYLNNICENVLLDFKASFDPCLISLATAIVSNLDNFDTPIEIQRLQFFISSLLAPAVTYVVKADEYPELSTRYLELLKAMVEKSFKVFFPLLVESPSYEAIINSIFFSITGLREISSLSLQNLRLFFSSSLEHRMFSFFNRFYLTTLENVLGLIFDKDMRQNYDMQVSLLFEMMSYLNRIPSLNNSGNNHSIVRDFIISLFIKNFKNLTESSVKIFIEGIIEIKNSSCFKDHLDDFNVKIYEYGDDEDIQDELSILRERVAKGV